jgi:WD40 repeat protein
MAIVVGTRANEIRSVTALFGDEEDKVAYTTGNGPLAITHGAGTQAMSYHYCKDNTPISECARLAVAPNGKWMAVAGDLEYITKHSTALPSIYQRLSLREFLVGNDVLAMAISDDSQFVAIIIGGSYLCVFNAEAWSLRFHFANGTLLAQSICFTGPDNGIFAADARSGEAFKLSRDNETLFFCRSKTPVRCVGSDPSGAWLVTATHDCRISVWSGADGQHLREWAASVSYINELMFVGSCRIFVSVCLNGSMAVWDPVDGSCLARTEATPAQINCAAIARSGAHLVLGDKQGRVWLYRGAALPWAGTVRFLFDGSNFARMTTRFQTEARTFLLCCARHRTSGAEDVLGWLPYELRQMILIELSLLQFL